MNVIDPGEFIRRLKRAIDEYESRFAFFIGAGCSISSGIPSASTLASEWLRALKQLKTGSDAGFDEWIKDRYQDCYDNPALCYGRVIEELFPSANERQREIEKRTERVDPGFGYAVLAQLMGHEKYGRYCNMAITTNFDDLIADALYLYTQKKPLVIYHESLAAFVRISETKPTIIKVHGDARLAPKNTKIETSDLAVSFKEVLNSLLCEVGLIFMGYGGNDISIAKILTDLPGGSLPWGVYWINDYFPDNEFGDRLQEKGVFWVKHQDFDELMLLMRQQFAISHPDQSRLSGLFKKYFDSVTLLDETLAKRPGSSEKQELEAAIKKAVSEFKDGWSVIANAKKDPANAESIYRNGMRQFPRDANIMTEFAIFLHGVKGERKKAGYYLKKAVETNPANPIFISNYANFLSNVLKDHDKAEEYYKKAIDIDPNNSSILGSYAYLLYTVCKDFDKAEEYYKKAVETSNSFFGEYASLLEDVRQDYDKAEEYHKKAIAIDPVNPHYLGNYARFLYLVRKNFDMSEEYYRRAVDIDPNNPNILFNYALLLHKTRKNYEIADEYYKKAIDIAPNDPHLLSGYACFLELALKDYDTAEVYYKKSFKINPIDCNTSCNFAGILLAKGKLTAGFRLLERCYFSCISIPAWELEYNFYSYAHKNDETIRRQSLLELKRLLVSNIRSLDFDFRKNVERAIRDKHPFPDFLAVLAKVITGEVEVEQLDNFDLWRRA